MDVDFEQAIRKTDVEMQRLGWTKEQGREYLIKNYGKRSRVFLTKEELLDFLTYLESQPTLPNLLDTHATKPVNRILIIIFRLKNYFNYLLTKVRYFHYYF